MRQYIDLLENASVKAELEARFGDESNYPIRYNKEDEGTEITGYGWWATCTSWASFVRDALPGRAKRFGFWTKDNPAPGLDRLCDGHDFAVVDGRYIVDGWLKNVEMESPRAVFDMQDPADADIIARFYGDPEKWTPEH